MFTNQKRKKIQWRGGSVVNFLELRKWKSTNCWNPNPVKERRRHTFLIYFEYCNLLFIYLLVVVDFWFWCYLLFSIYYYCYYKHFSNVFLLSNSGLISSTKSGKTWFRSLQKSIFITLHTTHRTEKNPWNLTLWKAWPSTFWTFLKPIPQK